MLIWRKLLDIASILNDAAGRYLLHSLRLEHRKDGRDYAVVSDGTMLLAASWDGARLQRAVGGNDAPGLRKPDTINACNITKTDVTRLRAAFPARAWLPKLLRVRFGAKQASIRAIPDHDTNMRFKSAHVDKAAPTARIGVSVTNQDGVYPPWVDVVPIPDGGITVTLSLPRLKRLVDALSSCDSGAGSVCHLTVQSHAKSIELTLDRSPDGRRDFSAEGELPADLKVSGLLMPLSIADGDRDGGKERMMKHRAFPVGVGLTKLD